MRQSKKDAVRLNKLISDAGFCSRREADEYIEQERVTVNGHTAKMGDKAYRTDFIRIDGEPLRFIEKVAVEKPKPEFLSKRITRNLGGEPKKSKAANTVKGKEDSPKVKKEAAKGDVFKKAGTHAALSSKPSTKPEKKEGAAKKWFSGRKK